jgi:Phage tail sheath protein subtilisin-like domain/Phage tail sheath C-terminal domain
MAGGTFTNQNKIRPGAYINFQSAKKARVGLGASGSMAMTLALDWGKTGFTEIEANTDIFSVLGRTLEEAELFPLREALKSAGTVLLYNVAGSSSAQASGFLATGIKAKAKYKGILGNEIKVTCDEELSGDYVVTTYYRGYTQDKQTVTDAIELKENAYVTFEVTEGSELEESALSLTGGTTERATSVSYNNYFNELELQDFYAFTFDSEETTLKETAVSFCKKWRDKEGKKCVLVISKYKADYEGVINVTNGVILTSGRKVTAHETLPFVAGSLASAGIEKSLTYTVYNDAVDTFPRLTSTEIEKGLLSGEFLFSRSYNNVVVEQDINTLTTFTDENKIVRVLDAFNNSLARRYAETYTGKVVNDIDGRDLLKKDIIAIFEQFKTANAIEEYSDEDIEIIAGIEKDTVVVNVALTVTDAMEKLYTTVTLR